MKIRLARAVAQSFVNANTCEGEEEVILARDREVMEACCKAVCMHCAAGGDEAKIHEDAKVGLYHGTLSDGAPCWAAGIRRALMAEGGK